jgi:4-amino-4-deoxy-L-arabinose transferase-like glycosyltransferase
LLLVAGLVVGLLIALAHAYGYHRDELYFLVAGKHLAWSYPDQGPLTPLLAHVMSQIAPNSLTVLRIPSALMAGGSVLVTGLIAHEFGGSARAQLLAASGSAAAPFVLAVGHLLSTTTYDVFAWSLVIWLISRGIRTRRSGVWLVAGFVSGTALLNKPLIAALLAAVAVSILIVGPREPLRMAAPWISAAIAVAIWSPWLVWQAHHGWPQLHISSSIANGGSASSQPRWAFIPFQFLLAGPPLAPIWLAGLVGLVRRPILRPYRCFAVSWLLLAVVFEVAGGKPYYLAGMFPVLFAAGALETDVWIERGRRTVRRNILLGAVLLSALAAAVIDLPVLPADDAGPVVAMNSDVGETIGWPQLVREVAAVSARAPQPTVIVTENYGEAGAVDRFGGAFGLPRAFSGHNGFGEWGPPPPGARSIVTVGISWLRLGTYFRGCHHAGQVTNADGIDNEERGALIAVCAAPRESWAALWPRIRHLS